MKKLLLILNLFIFVNCSDEGKAPEVSPDNAITNKQINNLILLREKNISWAPTCVHNSLEYPCFEGGHDGDQMLFLGLLGASGNTQYCESVYLSQSNNGKLWRSPSRVENQIENSFSRDMLLGYLLCQIVSPNKKSAEIFIEYVIDNNYKLCLDATDDRCSLNPIAYRTIWGEMKRIWNHIGLKPTFEMQQGDIGDDHLLKTYTEFAPLMVGFNLHLVATELYIRRKLNTWTDTLQKAAERVASTQPENPYFEYLAWGKTKRSANLTLKYCPLQEPSKKSQWMWQREQLTQDWDHPSGWECIFMANILIGDK